MQLQLNLLFNFLLNFLHFSSHFSLMLICRYHQQKVLLGSPEVASTAANKDLVGCCTLSLKYTIQVEPSYLTHHLTGFSQWLQKQISGSGGIILLRLWFQLYNINDSLLNNLKFRQWMKTFLPRLRNSRLICIKILNKYLQTEANT